MFSTYAFIRNLYFLFTSVHSISLVCQKPIHHYATHIFERSKIQINKIKPEHLSKETCFTNKKISFKMGTDRPLINSDDEGPSRHIALNNFCIDQTEVSNMQFYEFVQETKFVTEVRYNNSDCKKRFNLRLKLKKAETQGDSFCLINLLSENMKKFIRKKVTLGLNLKKKRK